MSILIGRYEFDGPYENVADLEDKPGLYAVLHYENDEYELVHVAQAENIRDRIELSQTVHRSPTHSGKVLLAGCYTRCGARERNMMVEDILREFEEQDKQEWENQLIGRTGSRH